MQLHRRLLVRRGARLRRRVEARRARLRVGQFRARLNAQRRVRRARRPAARRTSRRRRARRSQRGDCVRCVHALARSCRRGAICHFPPGRFFCLTPLFSPLKMHRNIAVVWLGDVSHSAANVESVLSVRPGDPGRGEQRTPPQGVSHVPGAHSRGDHASHVGHAAWPGAERAHTLSQQVRVHRGARAHRRRGRVRHLEEQ